MFLTAHELRELTGKWRRSSQVAALRAMGVEHKVRPDGTVAVLLAHVNKLFGHDAKATKKKESQPDWSAI